MVPATAIIKESIDSRLVLKCNVIGDLDSSIFWERLNDLSNSLSNQSLPLTVNERINFSNEAINDSQIESKLIINTLSEEDNGTYICKAKNKYKNETQSAMISVFVIQPPQLSLDLIETFTSTSVKVYWTILNDGNTPVQRLALQIRNLSSSDVDYIGIDNNIEPNQTSSYVIKHLLPAIDYEYRLAAFNDAGQSKWVYLNHTLPPDVPPRVTELHVLNKTNRTISLGWKRPLHNNGADINQYQLQLLDADYNIIYNYTSEVKSNTSGPQRNIMFIFTKLEPASNYIAQVRACSVLGCGNWSEPRLKVMTLDGTAEPPHNVLMKCYLDQSQGLNKINITWDPPADPKGTIIGYNISVEGHSNYKNSDNKLVSDSLSEIYQVEASTRNITIDAKPNTNFSVRICTINKASCGHYTHITSDTICYSSPTIPASFSPGLNWTLLNSSDIYCRKLKLYLHRVSERNGHIKCYQVVIIRLPKNLDYDHLLPSNPIDLNITNYEEVHSSSNDEINATVGAYIAEEMTSESLKNEVIIGDNSFSTCEDSRIPRKVDSHLSKNFTLSLEIEDGPLDPSTNYTGFILIRVLGPNGIVLNKPSNYFNFILTGSLKIEEPPPSSLTPIFSSINESAGAFLLAIFCGLALVLLVLFTMICFLRRKVNNALNESSEEERLGLTALLRRTVGNYKNGHIVSNGIVNSINSSHKWIGQAIVIENLPKVFVERHANSDLLFQAEFEALPENFNDRTSVASELAENFSKNRYPDIKCYDQTRVKLTPDTDLISSDYINANFVEGYKGRKLYISSQGPLDRTVTDFWRMIYQHKVSVVVMLTGIEEHGKIKCAQYWQDSGTMNVENLYKLTLQSCRKYSDFVARRFILEKFDPNENDKPRDILQFHFLMWKDFLAPEQPSWLLRFIKRVNEHYCEDKGPLLVHCSAGVGRTGTFIAIDSLIPEITSGSSINIFECVSQLRYQRNYLVQSFKQYIFVYRALMEFAQFGDTEIEICHLRDHYRQLKEQKFEGNVNGLMAEFDVNISYYKLI